MENNVLEIRNENNKKLNFIITMVSCVLVLLIDVFASKGQDFLLVMLNLSMIVVAGYYVTFKSKNQDLKIVIVPLLFILGTFMIAFIQKGVPQAIACIVVSFLMCSSYFRYDLLKIFFIISDIIIFLFSLGFEYLLGFSFAKSTTYFDDIMKMIGLLLIECMLLGILKFTNTLFEMIEKQRLEVNENLIKKEELIKSNSTKFVNVMGEIKEIFIESENISDSLKEFEKGIDSQVKSISDINSSVSNTVSVVNKVKDTSEYIKNVAFTNLINVTKTNVEQLVSSNNNIHEVTTSLKNTDNIVQSFNDNINNIIKVLSSIQSISDNVNLLSLNASIEAARAGESGRGFGVVAQEIKKLSAETKETTIVIDSHIKEIQKDLNLILTVLSRNSNITENTQSTMNEVVENFNAMREVFENINNSLDQEDKEVQRAFDDMQIIQNSMESCIAITEEYAATIEDIVNRQNNQDNLLQEVKGNLNDLEQNILKF